MAMLEVDGVQTYYGRVRALTNVGLHLDTGEIVALIGSNGAGKTTTLRTISGLLQPASGRIRFDGADITGMPAARRVAMGICHIPEGRRLFPRMTVRDNLTLGAFTRRDGDGAIQTARERVFELFPLLRERQTQLAGTLSGGEQQMLAIGRAMMSSPKVLMMDEPSLGLAPILVKTIFQIITEINHQGTPILLVEQNAHKALEIAHRAYVLETGSIVRTGRGEELLHSEDVVKAYLGM
jgi:branched-chain amino acid transport system ATP-binding protein